MRFKIIKGSRDGIRAIFLLFLIIMLAACASDRAAQKKTADIAENNQAKKILNIDIEQGEQSAILRIAGNGFLNYASVKQPEPLGIIMHFPETAFDGLKPVNTAGYPLIQSVRWFGVEKTGNGCRIEILLGEDVVCSESRTGNDIILSLHKEAPQEMFPEVTKADNDETIRVENLTMPPVKRSFEPATRIERVDVSELQEGIRVLIGADGQINNYKTFTIDNPPRVVLDVFDITGRHQKEQVIPVNSRGVEKVRHFSYPDRLRLVVDTMGPKPSKYFATPVENGLVLDLGVKEAPAPVVLAAKRDDGQSARNLLSEPALVKRIDFFTEDLGKSVVLIETSAPVTYDINKTDKRHLQLKLFNTNLPDYRQRPLITTRFESAIDRILPMQAGSMKNVSLFEIDLRESVPYMVEQDANSIKVRFEASSIPPRALETAGLPPWAGAGGSVDAAGSGMDGAGIQPPASKEDRLYLSGQQKKYAGEKIALDFYETDVKNVFRILHSISGKNFVIDKDVGGKVTMSLQTPVPWDQVLDLILTMNQLRAVEEGNIVRIATLATLKKEDELKRAKIEAEQKKLAQQKALEPLVTEYIAINYSSANDDILPHLEKLVTPNRGSLSVDERGNQLIMTDTADKIKKAWEIVRKIDQVTPQVVIEARIVEVSDNFAKNLGIDWGATIGPIDINGSDLTLDTTFNFPSASSSSMGINFANLGGTPVLLNARLTALETEGQAEVISSPRIITLDNKEASIKQGLEVPYLERDDSGGSSVKFKKVDLLLTVTPHVTPDQRISMSMFITKNDVQSVIDGVPILSTNEATTELLIEDGDTIVIGGVVKTSKTRGKEGFPVLADIPVLGALFKSTSQDEQKNELLIFITPRIVQLEQRS